MRIFGKESVYVIPAHHSFIESLATGLLERFQDPAGLARVLLFLPNRRGVRAMQEMLVHKSPHQALMMPRMMALGDLDEVLETAEEGQIDISLIQEGAVPSVSTMERVLLLLPEMMAWMRQHRLPHMGEAVLMTAELLKAFDQLQYSTVTAADVRAKIAREEFADHWQTILDFLDIALARWPQILAQRGAYDPVAVRIRRFQSLAQVWRQTPPTHPVIAAGSTGTIAAVRALLSVIASLENGTVILPAPYAHGHSVLLQEDAWSQLGPTHPAYAFKQVLSALNRAPESLHIWPYGQGSQNIEARMQWVEQALLPPKATYLWHAQTIPEMTNVHLAELDTQTEEAQAIAIAMRQALDVPGRTAALVTPDRTLARRVKAALMRFGIAVDDSAGEPLAQSSPARFMALLLDAARQALAPVALLSLCKHDLCCAGLSRAAWLHQVRTLDAHVVRGVRPAPGLAGLRQAARHYDMTDFLDALEKAVTPWVEAFGNDTPQALRVWVELHIQAATALATSAEQEGSHALWHTEAGRILARTLEPLRRSDIMVAPHDYAILFSHAVGQESVRDTAGLHPRLHIWGTLEARLQRCDMMILGGLNEGTWPQGSDIDPFFNNAMRAQLGLPTTEFRIGQSAQDFFQAMGAERVLLTRTRRSDSGVCVPSRFLLRLEACTPAGIPSDDRLIEQTRSIDVGLALPPLEEPAPCPPISARPRDLYVTDVERWRSNPYAFYARRILRLKPLDTLDMDPGGAERGIRIHEALQNFLQQHTGFYSQEQLEQDMHHAFGDLSDRPAIQALWQPRLKNMIAWIIDHLRQEPAWTPVAVETTGAWLCPDVHPPFIVRGRADRLDLHQDGASLRVVDYKTGAPPSKDQLKFGFALQLPVLALIAELGGFDDLPARTTTTGEFWCLEGKDEKGGYVESFHMDDQMRHTTQRTVVDLIKMFDQPSMPYKFRHGPKRGGGRDYDHLARVLEWQGRR